MTWLSAPSPERPFDAAAHDLRLKQVLARRSGGADLGWELWLLRHFAGVCTAPFAERHRRLWEWLEALQPGSRPRPQVEVWPRGSAKSTTAELGCVRAGVRLSRRFALYVSRTQDQADKHVQAIASFFDALGVSRAVGRYGHSKGWRRDQLRTANGFNVAAIGLDVATRGVKLDQYRPDLLILDDLDSQHDTARTVEKNITALTTAIFPAGAADLATLFIQNVVHEDSIMAQLLDGRADFLRERTLAVPEVAVRGLQVESVDRGDGVRVYRITGGTPTWAGQDLATCEQQINLWGLRAFRREAQHEVEGGEGYFFDTSQIRYVSPAEVPGDLRYGRAWDLAGTHGGGDWTVGILGGVQGHAPNATLYLLDVRRGQWSSDHVRRQIGACRESDPPKTVVRLPQDPGQAGKDQASQMHRQFPGAVVRQVTGSKATRAAGVAEAMGRGNVRIVLNADGSEPAWAPPLLKELRQFEEDEPPGQVDDQCDALADLWNELAGKRTWDVY